jgi:hypothetical protein
MEMIDRMNAEFAGPAARLDKTLDRRHRIDSLPNRCAPVSRIKPRISSLATTLVHEIQYAI